MSLESSAFIVQHLSEVPGWCSLCVCVCVCVRARARVCVCMCVCARSCYRMLSFPPHSPPRRPSGLAVLCICTLVFMFPESTKVFAFCFRCCCCCISCCFFLPPTLFSSSSFLICFNGFIIRTRYSHLHCSTVSFEISLLYITLCFVFRSTPSVSFYCLENGKNT